MTSLDTPSHSLMTTIIEPALLASVIAHRGASGEAPENTLAAMALAYEQGARCVEIDVSISADHVPFVHHDDTLDRCTSGSGLLCEHTADQLDSLHACKRIAGFDNEPLPRLSAVFDYLIQHEMGLNLEIKPRQGLEAATVEAVCSLVETSWPAHLPMVFSSFSRPSLMCAKQRLPDIPRGLLVGSLPDDWLQLVERYACRNLHCEGARLSPQQAEQLCDKGLGVYCYTVNDVSVAQNLLDSGIHGVITDYPQRLLSALQL